MSHYFTYRSLDDLRADVAARSVDVRLEEDVSHLFRPVTIGTLTAGNRLTIHPMEGCDGTLDGRPDELTFRRWNRFGAGGAKLIWGEATAIVPEGRANPRQLLINPDTVRNITRMLADTRRAHRERFGQGGDLVVGLQLTHSGRWSYPDPLIARHSATLDPLKHIAPNAPTLDDSYLERLVEEYARAAKLAMEAGFDFVDVKQCHSYLLNELLGARNREGEYGGSFENRTRLVRTVIEAIKRETGGRLQIASRLSVYDGPRFGAPAGSPGEPMPDQDDPGFGVSSDGVTPDMGEPLRLVGLLAELGVRLINVTIGSPYFNPHISRPFERAPVDGYDPPEHPLVGVERHFAMAAEMQRAYPEVTMVGTGYSWLRHYAAFAGEANVRAGRVSMMGLGRGALAYPDFAADLMETGAMVDRKSCISISYCTALMRAKNHELGQFPAGCAPRDPFYAAEFKRSQGRA